MSTMTHKQRHPHAQAAARRPPSHGPPVGPLHHPDPLLHLQRTLGNQAVLRLIAQTNSIQKSDQRSTQPGIHGDSTVHDLTIQPSRTIYNPHTGRAKFSTLSQRSLVTAVPQFSLQPNTQIHLRRRSNKGNVRPMLAQPTVVQRGPEDQKSKIPTNTWEYNEQHQGRTTMLRTTKIVADAWGEVGPMPPRINYRREVEIKTRDGVTVYLDIRGTVYLPQGTKLPTTPEAALAMAGLLVRSQRLFKVAGGDLVPVNEYQSDELASVSILASTNKTFPDYAHLPLNVVQQEEAILRHLANLKRREKAKPKNKGSIADTIVATGTDLLPIIGELKDAYRAITGIDPDTGEKLRWWERMFAALSAIPFVGKLFKGLGKGIRWLGKGLGFLGEQLGKFRRWLRSKFPNKKQLPSGGQQAGTSTKVATKTGTVWDKINPTGPMRPNTAIPQYFELETAQGKFFVNTNGTKHMEELVVGSKGSKDVKVEIGGKEVKKDYSNTGEKVSHSAQMRSQAVLDSFAQAVQQAERQGIKYGEIMNIGPWELIIEKTGKSGPLPVVKHAVARGI